MGIFKFFKKNYWVFLLLATLISYGQTLWMDVWRDANAIFFKFNHLNEPAGYLGVGLLGSGTYKFSVTPYWFIYKIVGYKYIFPYYLLNLFFYFLASYCVYLLFSKLISKNVGRLAGFLFAAGYVASEGFFSLDSSMILNVSVILISLSLIFYKKYYFISLFWYLFAVFLTPVRVHYFIGVIFVFDIFWIWRFKFKKIHLLILRILPFALAFYYFYIKSADSRTFLIIPFIKDIVAGKFFNLYSTFGSLGYLFLPDKQLASFASLPFAKAILIILFFSFIYLIFKARRFIKRILFFYLISSVFAIFFANIITSYPQVGQSIQNAFAVFLGEEIMIFLLSIIFLVKREVKFQIIFLCTWLFASLITYTSYEPTNIYITVERYLGHSFLPVVGIFAISAINFPKNKLIYLVAIVWGVLNIFNSVNYQHDVLINRSFPTRTFYSELKNYLPKIDKGDILYFDVANDASGYFDAAFSVGQMPDETAIAWRYGVDRYDFRRVTDYKDLTALIKDGNFVDVNNKPLSIDNIYSFYYSKNGLIDTTSELNKFIKGTNFENADFKDLDNTISFNENIPAYTPTTFNLNIKANISNDLNFPYIIDKIMQKNSTSHDLSLRNLAFEYQKYKENFLNTAKISASSDWRENITINALDNNRDSVWQPDRILWHDGKQYLQIDLGRVEEINRFVWVNAYANNTPTHYFVYLSSNGTDWKQVYEGKSSARVESGSTNVAEFASQNARYVRFGLAESLNDDSPGISEVWVVPSEFSKLDIKDAEEFLKEPLGYVSDAQNYKATINALGNKGSIQIYWKSNKSEDWETDFKSNVNVTYDGISRNYDVILPANGTEIEKIKFDDIQIPGDLKINNIQWKK